ncbi:tRNA epoxyqueuosine(34) reductase QueG [Anaerobacillus alkalidiazotrophicus]|uniref:tRNA epoxyqueuosine(34) reductase QueG n=1 Tax=Anaerobacillus alkalidiazotrophicus TaxID=472963 RepID=A0A1S2MCF3_9BACI|nr:tRNA epoxyqueuosine(34) reductase QueG [Anaerobacillus alkalidiazotrophicus]OIJ21507.1 tRNA epoxyqueuosine(34) reductase QueG [Anaerobacillus alkalidiazotrophicus]
MTLAQLKQEIIAYSISIGIDKIGFASADPFVDLKDKLINQQDLGYQSGFEEPDIDKRVHPELLLPEAKSIIAIALAYPSKMKHAPLSTKGARRGLFCRASWGEDYHKILKRKMEQLEAFILEKAPNARVVSMVDTGELSDRAVAQRAGIGWSGKNCSIITEEFGSYVYLGEIITTLALPPDTPITEQCGSCTKCIDACPTGAIVQGGQLDSNKCIAFLTQTKTFLADEYREKIGNRIYGCDTCQQVCPENKGKDFHLHDEMEPDPEVVKPLLKELLFISNRQFKETYGLLSGAWRGKKPLQRNAIIALAHFKDVNAITDLERLLKEDPRPVIRGTAAWAIGKIAAEKSELILKVAKEREKDADVLREIEKGLNLLENHNI